RKKALPALGTSLRLFPYSSEGVVVSYFAGLDLGQAQDFTALVVLEQSVIDDPYCTGAKVIGRALCRFASACYREPAAHYNPRYFLPPSPNAHALTWLLTAFRRSSEMRSLYTALISPVLGACPMM